MKKSNNDSLDNILDLLTNSDRRQILYQMQNAEEETFTYDELVDTLTEEDQTEREAYIHLIHQHLPKMEEKGAIDNFNELEKIKYNPCGELENLLEDIKKYEENLPSN
jgi:predicted transcriptional regulator